MRGLPPHQAVFREEQQVAAGRGNLRLSGCQIGIAAESPAIYLTLLTSALFPSEEEEMGGEGRGAFCSASLHWLMWGWGTYKGRERVWRG